MATIKEIKDALKAKGYKTTAFVGKNKAELEEMLSVNKEVNLAEPEEKEMEIIDYSKENLTVNEPKTVEYKQEIYTIINEKGELIKKTHDKKYAETFIAGNPEKRFLK